MSRHPHSAIFTAAFTATLLILSGMATTSALARQSAQTPSGVEHFDFLVGDWEGDAWTMTREGRISLHQTEHVEMRLRGTVVVVEGTGRALDDGGEAGEVLFNALGVISRADSSGYRMNSWLLDGRSGEFAVTAEEDGFTWTMETPYGSTRYTMTLTTLGEWHEVGEFSRDGGKTWMRVFEMKLRKLT